MKLNTLILLIVLGTAFGSFSAAPQAKKQPKIDLVFCVDTTGSMSDEIEVVKVRMKDMIAKIADGNPCPKVRVGIVAYRDRGDEYVTRKLPLTDDLDEAFKNVTSLVANGGGDKEESVDEALHVAISEMNWDETPKITRLVYLIGDAGPKQYEKDFDPDAERKTAVGKGIIVNAIGCSGITDTETAFFKKMAQGAEGTFAYLTYREEYAKADGTRAVKLTEGSVSYKYDAVAGSSGPAGPAADWKAGADKIVATGAASPATVGSFADAMKPAAGAMVRAKDGWQINGATLNNLDVVMTRQAQDLAAKQQGIKYVRSDLVPFLRELQGDQTGVKSETRLVIKDAKTWKQFWTKHQAGRKTPEALPKVDFKHEMVLVVAVPGAAKNNIVLREAADQGGKLVVNYAVSSVQSPGPQPFHFAVVKKTAEPVEWVKGK